MISRCLTGVISMQMILDYLETHYFRGDMTVWAAVASHLINIREDSMVNHHLAQLNHRNNVIGRQLNIEYLIHHPSSKVPPDKRASNVLDRIDTFNPSSLYYYTLSSRTLTFPRYCEIIACTYLRLIEYRNTLPSADNFILMMDRKDVKFCPCIRLCHTTNKMTTIVNGIINAVIKVSKKQHS